ncbi:thioredoxin domain-containing protein [Candidatus Uhrbacteria bacterium]|nr:thioredoxin domain-containing protein [Candidatus Uhrbacteria bacterium]
MSQGLDSLPPRTAFFTGLGLGVLGVCTLGFFILLGTMTSGGSLFARGGEPQGATTPTTNPSPAPSPTPAPSQPGTGNAGSPPPVTASDHVLGSGDARITLIEYSDLECPFCKRFHPTLQQIVDEYDGEVRWVYRDFPLSFHANAQKEAEAAECAGELGGNEKYWAFIDTIFERTTANGTGFALDALAPLAGELGLNEGQFTACLDSGRYAQAVRDEMNGGAAAGVTGTPGTFVIGPDGESQLIPGALPYESVKQVIDSLLAG